jgi:hypothetical protein
MADLKISALTGATTPLAGTEVLPIVQGGSTVKVAVSNLTAGRAVSAASLALTTTPLPVSSGGTGLTAVTAGYIPFGNSATALNTDAVLFWDNTNKRLGIGNSSPAQKIQIGDNPGNNGASNYLLIAGSGGTGQISSGVKLFNYWNGIPYETGIYASQTDNASAELALKVGYFDGVGASQRTGLFINQDANVSLPLGNLAFGTSGKGITNASGTVALNLTTTEATIQGSRFGLGPGAVTGNTVFGDGAFNSNTTAGLTTAIGYQALFSSNRTADATGDNTAVGHQAGYETTTGQKNTYFGRYAGNQLATGSNNVYVGAYSTASASNVTNEIILGYNITGKGSNTAYVGGSSGAYNQANSATWSITSDSRIKENVTTLTDGLESILKLRPVKFNYIINKNPDVSFIAQEYELVFPEQIVQHAASQEEKELTNSDTLYGVRQNLVPYLVSAIQELKAEIDLLKSKVGSN